MQTPQPNPTAPGTSAIMKWGFAIGAVLISILLWVFSQPLAQDPGYHNFADQRQFLGLPHTLNVLSNLIFCVAGILGGVLAIRHSSGNSRLYKIYLVLFTGIFLTGFGSAYYHWSPDNSSLVWDRLPMTIAFMSFTSVIVFERYSESLGYKLFPWLLIVGFLSVAYWVGQDDLRPYVAVQFVPILILPIIILRFSGPGTGWLCAIIVFYVIAKILELYDAEVFQLTAGITSGHTLKHIAAGFAALMIAARIRSTKKKYYE